MIQTSGGGAPAPWKPPFVYDTNPPDNLMSRTQSVLRRLFTTPYRPQPLLRSFLSRGQTQEGSSARVTVAVLNAAESEQVFGVPLARRGIQPVFRVSRQGSLLAGDGCRS